MQCCASSLPNATRFSSCENSAKIVGQTPWSARVPLDPLFATGSISSKREGRPGGRPRTGGPPHNFCRPSGHGKNNRLRAASPPHKLSQFQHRFGNRLSAVGFTLMLPALKIGLGVTAVAAAMIRPDFGEGAWRRFEQAMAQMARRRTSCWIGMGLLVLLVRAALLPLWPIPKPVIYDEFGYLLQADTFASGRLTNRPHPLWPFFESIYILQQPTYNAKYPPGQGLALAAGQLLVGHAWFGVWLTCGALMAALCWALQGWLPPAWALFGAFLALRLCLFSYWMNSYWGGAVAGIGGALVLGAYPRIVRQGRSVYAWLLGLGLVILANTRMYEGALYAVPILIALGSRPVKVRVWATVASVLALGA